MDLAFWKGLFELSAPVALAIFAIWILQREFKRQIEEGNGRLVRLQQEHEVQLEQDRRAHEERLADMSLQRRGEQGRYRDERVQFVEVIERNSEAWQQATKVLTELASGLAMLCSTIEVNREALRRIQMLLATRPCIGDAVLGEDKQAKAG